MFFFLSIVLLFPYIYLQGIAFPILSLFAIFLPFVRFSKEEIMFWGLLSISILLYAVGASGIIENSISLTKSLIANFLVFMLISILIKRYKLKGDNLISLVVWVGVLNAFISISTTLIADLRFIYDYIATNPKVFSYPIPRYPGLVYDGFSYLSVFYALIHLICMQLWLEKKVTTFRFLFTTSLMFVGIITSGRMGLLIGIIGSIFLILKNRSFRIGRISLAGIILFSGTLAANQYSSLFSEYLVWSLNAILIFAPGSIATDTTAVELFNNHFFFIGESFTDFLFGTFDFGFPGGSYNSDVGWVRIFNGFGLIGIVSVLISTWYLTRHNIYLTIFGYVFLIGLFKDWYFLFPYYFWAVGFALYFATKKNYLKNERL